MPCYIYAAARQARECRPEGGLCQAYRYPFKGAGAMRPFSTDDRQVQRAIRPLFSSKRTAAIIMFALK
jgi:hypothetical protein